MTKRRRWIGLAMLTGLLVVGMEGAAWAVCGTCQVCKWDSRALLFENYFCEIANNESGSICCELQKIGWDTFCWETGDACYGIIVDGGGGSGGGGGTTCSYQNGWCPAACMSCSGGTRPAI